MISELFQPTHLLMLVVLVVLLFGGRRIASLGRGFRDGIANFKVARKDPGKKHC